MSGLFVVFIIFVKRSMLQYLLIQINVVEHYRQEAERKIYRILCDRVASIELGAAGVRAYTCVPIIDIYHGFLEGHKLIVVRGCAYLLCGIVTAIKAEGLAL